MLPDYEQLLVPKLQTYEHSSQGFLQNEAIHLVLLPLQSFVHLSRDRVQSPLNLD